MKFALNKDDEKIKASKDKIGICEHCRKKLIACVGGLVPPYWRHEHESDNSCVVTTPAKETYWHGTWKYLFGKEFKEVSIKIGKILKRADICLPNKLVIEIQHSYISSYDIIAREKHYKKMIWVHDVSGRVEDDRFRNSKTTFEWINPIRLLETAKTPVFLDVGYSKVFEVFSFTIRFIESEVWDFPIRVYEGKGQLMTREEFKNRMLYSDIALKKYDNKKPFKEEFMRIPNAVQTTMF